MAGPSGWGVSQSKQRTLVHRELQRAFPALRPAEEVFFRSMFTTRNACGTEGTGRLRAESNLEKNQGAALVAHGGRSLRITNKRAAAISSGLNEIGRKMRIRHPARQWAVIEIPVYWNQGRKCKVRSLRIKEPGPPGALPGAKK